MAENMRRIDSLRGGAMLSVLIVLYVAYLACRFVHLKGIELSKAIGEAGLTRKKSPLQIR